MREAMERSGIGVPAAGLIADGKIHRFAPNGRRDASAWFVLHGDHGAYGDWSKGVSETWREHGRACLTEDERRTLSQSIEEARRQRDEEDRQRHERVAAQAIEAWNKMPGAGMSPYLKRKQVEAFGVRYDEKNPSTLVVPIRDVDGRLWSFQTIDSEGCKLFLAGGRKRGCFHLIGADGLTAVSSAYVAEGYATGASIHMATGKPVIVAFDSGNLERVVAIVRERFTTLELVMAGDDDKWRPDAGNIGRAKAEAAANKYGFRAVFPTFRDEGRKPTDWNDLHVAEGLDVVRKQLQCLEWPAPNPIQAPLPAVIPFDADVLLPEVLRTWVMDEANRKPCPPDYIAAAVMVVLGSVIGARCAIKPKSKDDWLIVPNLWGGIVGPPSAKKTPAITAAMKPLERLIALAFETHEVAKGAFATDNIVFDAQKEEIGRRLKGATKTTNSMKLHEIAAEFQQHLSEAPAEPVLHRYKTNDTTVEKLGELLRENPGGILVSRDELVGLLVSWDKAGHEGDRAFFLEAWNGNQSFDTDRIGRGSIFIPNLCVSLFGGIQPDKLIAYLEQATNALANDGMLQRFQLLVYPDHREWEWRDLLPNKEARDGVYKIFDKLAGFDPVAWGAAPADDFSKFPYFRFTPEAQDIFIGWSSALHKERIPKERNAIIEQHLAKYDKLFPALALIFHLVDCAVTGQGGAVSKQAAMLAVAWCEYLESHARRCYGLLLDDGLRSAQALVKHIESGDLRDVFTARDVRRNQWRHLTKEEAVQAALDWLVDEHWLRGSISGTGVNGGRPTMIYRINPKVSRKTRLGDANVELA